MLECHMHTDRTLPALPRKQPRAGTQAGPVMRVSLPEEAPGLHKGYAFCQYEDLVSAPWSEPG